MTRRRFHRTARGLSIIILSSSVAFAIVIFAAMAILDLYNPPEDSKLGHQAMAIGAGAVAGAMSLIGVYIGMGAGDQRKRQERIEREMREQEAA